MNLGTWSCECRAKPCIATQKTQLAQTHITRQGAALRTEAKAEGYADIEKLIITKYQLHWMVYQPSLTTCSNQRNKLNVAAQLFYNMRESRIENQLQQVRQLSWAQVIECSPKGIERDDLWIVWVPGRKGTLWEGGNYPVTITFPPTYPKASPSIKFEPQFKHVHVYQGGQICLPLIESQYWRFKTGMCDILQRILSLIHQEVNPYSPANLDLYRLMKESPEKYQELIKKQAEHYAKQNEKYFHQPCIHINIVGNE